MNFLNARIAANGSSLAVVPDGGPPLPIPPDAADRYRGYAGREVVLGIRPEHLTNVWEEGSTAARTPIEVNVELAEPLGADTLVFTRLGAAEVVCRLTTAESISVGQSVKVHADMSQVHIFDRETEKAL